MSGYVFPCTPCGFDHPGECAKLKCGCSGKCKGHATQAPPVDKSPTSTLPPDPGIVPYQVTINVGSRWRFEHRYPGFLPWKQAGYKDGFEVMAIVANAAGGAAVQVREWNAPQYPVYTCAIEWWDPDGIGASDGGRNRFVPWT